MPSLAVALPWVVVVLAALAVRARFAAADAPEPRPGTRSNRTVAEWDDGSEPLPA